MKPQSVVEGFLGSRRLPSGPVTQVDPEGDRTPETHPSPLGLWDLPRDVGPPNPFYVCGRPSEPEEGEGLRSPDAGDLPDRNEVPT